VLDLAEGQADEVLGDDGAREELLVLPRQHRLVPL
jgi:hypothetical protein